MIDKYLPIDPGEKVPKTSAQFVIMPSSDEMEVDEAMILQRDFDSGYVYSLPETINLKEKDWVSFSAEISGEIEKGEFFDYSSDKNKVFWKIRAEKYIFYITGDTEELKCTTYAKDEKTANTIWKIYVKHLREESNVKIFVENYFVSSSGLANNTKQLRPDDIGYISDLYYPYLDIPVMFDQFFTGCENILLCVGIPGVGKSKLATLALKYAHQNPDKIPYDKFLQGVGIGFQFINCAFVKGTEVLARDDFWRTLEDDAPDFVIIDDLDYMLTKRGADVQSIDDVTKNKFLNQFLSFTDGVEKYKTKFIITTNQNYDEIDTALLRKGRLFDILELRELTLKEALAIWEFNHLDAKVFNKLFKDKWVLPADLGSEISKRLNKRITNATVNYLVEKNISKLTQAKRSKRISI